MTLLKKGISVVIPVYNSQESLPELAARLETTLKSLDTEYETIFVNDGSKDKSWEIIQELATTYPFIIGINLMRNYGQHNALLAGVRSARYDILITMDDDLQHPPEEIPKLLSKLEEGYDVVYGSPQNEQHGLLRDMASVMTKMAMKAIINVDIAPHVSAFRAFHTLLRYSFENYYGTKPSLDVLLTWGTNKFSYIDVKHDVRAKGRSNYTLLKLCTHAMNMITGFSTIPLRLATFLGFAFTFFGGGLIIYVISRYLMSGTPVPGFPFLASIITIFSGVQLFTLGIFGEYLARMHTRLLDCPPFAIKEVKTGTGVLTE